LQPYTRQKAPLQTTNSQQLKTQTFKSKKMKKAIYKTLERFNDDNSGTFEALVLFFLLTATAAALVK
jgi:hypothetical protein